MEKPFFGIRISTYRRNNGTFHLLAKCLRSIIAQTFSRWKVFLIGDDYKPNEEFEKLASMIHADKLYHTNLPVSPERSKYSGTELWKIAGYTASCLGLSKIKEEEIPIHTCLDDDDWWETNHLQTLWETYQNFPEAAFVYTKSTYKSPNQYLPNEDVSLSYNNRPPRAYGLIHSAVSWDVQKIPLMYRNIMEEKSEWVAGDADMWERIRTYCEGNNLKTIYVPKLTVRHDSEQGQYITEPMIM